MRRTPVVAVWNAIAIALTCTTATPQSPTQSPAPLYAGPLDSARLATMVDSRLARAERLVETMLAVKGPRTPENTLRPWDQALGLVWEASGLADIAVNVYPDSLVRREGLRAVERVSKVRNAITSDPRAARAFSAVDTTRLIPIDRRLVAHTLRDLQRTGALLPEAQRTRLRGYLETLDRLGTAFDRNIAEDSTSFVVSEAELAGMPADWISRLKRDSRNRLIVTLQYPDFIPAQQYAANRSLRRRLRAGFENRGRQPNIIVLDSILRVREQAARLLGYRDWTAYQAEIRMAGSSDTIRSFIRRVWETAGPANAELNAKLLARLRREDSSVTRLGSWDLRYATELLRRSEYELDSREVRSYFPFKTVYKGILEVTAELFGVEIRPARLPVWHPSVRALEMRENGRLLGRFYLDLHPRPAKYQHAAVFPLRFGVAQRLPAEVMLVTNFPGEKPDEPGLMELNEVLTFFHEFGHLVHLMFARQPYGLLQWPQEFDFIEAPSEMLEEFVRTPAVLARLSRHVETGRPIPDTLVARIKLADGFSRPGGAAFDAALSALSLELHSHPPDSINVDSISYVVLTDYSGVDQVHPNHFATMFGHLGSAWYGPMYYTYLWSQVISKDLWSEFDPERPFDPGPARRYRDLVLRPGGGRPAGDLVREFLGRPFGFESWRRWLQGEEVARAMGRGKVGTRE